MADNNNIAAANVFHQQQQLSARFRIPNEVWTEAFTQFPRRILIQHLSPVSYRFKEICEKNVKSIHVITKADRFTDKLKANDPMAKQRLAHLMANGCQLAGQFRMKMLWICEKSQDILCHSLDLLRGCQLEFSANGRGEKDKAAFNEQCLGILAGSEPIAIRINQYANSDPDGSFWLHPTVQNCTRLFLWNWASSAANASDLISTYQPYQWLHHQPEEKKEECDGNAAETDQQVRCLIISRQDNEMDWLIDHCFENFKRSSAPSDRRQYVLSFKYCRLQRRLGKIENKKTGEALVLERVLDQDEEDDESLINRYRLRRCLAQEVAGGKELYAKLFKQRNRGKDAFNIDEETVAKVILQ